MVRLGTILVDQWRPGRDHPFYIVANPHFRLGDAVDIAEAVVPAASGGFLRGETAVRAVRQFASASATRKGPGKSNALSVMGVLTNPYDV